MPLPQDSVYVLLPLDAQKEKHFEEKFDKEQSTTFWYQDEKGIVSQLVLIVANQCMKNKCGGIIAPSIYINVQELLPPKFDSSSESSGDEMGFSGGSPSGFDDPWTLGEVSEKVDMSDLWVTEDTLPLTESKRRKYSISKHKYVTHFTLEADTIRCKTNSTIL